MRARSAVSRVGAVLAVLGLAAVLPLALAAPAAGAQDYAARAAAAFKSGDRVYVDPEARQVPPDQLARIEQRVSGANPPVFLAILPALSDQELGAMPEKLFQQTRQQGVYAVLAGTVFHAGASRGVGLERGEAGELAKRAAENHPGDFAGGIDQFVSDVTAAARGESPGGGGGLGLLAVAVLVLGGVGMFAWRRSQRTKERLRAAELAKVRRVVDEDITAYGEELHRLEFDPARVDEATRADYQRALDLYERAKLEMAAVRRPEDVRQVTQVLEEGRYALACAAARLAGRPLPERRPPCFFDPRHGPSATDVVWAPPGGAPRQVPVCRADAARIADGLDPMVRTVEIEPGRRVPYYHAGPAYAGWAGGYFDAFGGLLPALLVGTMLGSMLSPPMPGGWGFPGGEAGGEDNGWGEEPGGGDFDFGDFGGFDGGGGDW
ncbi:putative membrane protein [Carbonactinospora thermoautotrophica]|uniref:Putative membrane protein n=2 Tax=Carbonactinospora thermoautotrophica TaxID=1469144 RepID=A0A132MU29_9ACTN|nr:hypothetical protein [Carbonactinospora thermoautotrophica]KWX01339.1 putative membrane protein [Carbonactinospora thermoautotrophica]